MQLYGQKCKLAVRIFGRLYSNRQLQAKQLSTVPRRLMTHKASLPPDLDKWQMSAAYSPGRHNFIKCKYHWHPLETLKG